jgi:predicted ribosome-associated RNA-binding protein Tma20
MWAKIKAMLKKPLFLGLSVGMVILIGLILFRRRQGAKQVVEGAVGLAATGVNVVSAGIAKADEILPSL